VRDALLIIKILAECIQSHWTYCKDNFPLVDVADPGLDPGVAFNTLRIGIFYAYSSIEDPVDSRRLVERPPLMVKPAKNIIRYISESNWNVCTGVWKQNLANCQNSSLDQREINSLRMIEDLNMNLKQLTSILKGSILEDPSLIGLEIEVFVFLQKRAQEVVAISLRKAVMKWIDESPGAFVNLYLKKEDSISYHTEKVFDIIVSSPDINNRKETLWPLAMSVALLCPETLGLAIHAILSDTRNRKEYNYARISKKVMFLDNVRQCMRIETLSEISSICMTDFAKAAYLLPRDQQPELTRYALANEREMNALILDPSSRLYKNNKDRARLSQLVLDKLVAIYRADPKEFSDIAANKAFQASSNTYITFNMARFCREYALRTQAKSKSDDFGEIYCVVAPRIRRQLQYLLKLFDSDTPASPDRLATTKGATPVDKVDLVVEILRNYTANIDSALIGTKLDNKSQSSDQKVYSETAVLDSIVEKSVVCEDPEISEAGADLVELIYAPENAWRWTEYAKANPDEGDFFWQYTYDSSKMILTTGIP
jgi:hypothetical protein